MTVFSQITFRNEYSVSEYCNICEEFPPVSMSSVRGHVFKMCFHILQYEQFLYLRDVIAEIKTIDDVGGFISKLKAALEANKELVEQSKGRQCCYLVTFFIAANLLGQQEHTFFPNSKLSE